MIKEKIFGSNSSKFPWRARLKNFVYAWEGIVWFFKKEHNASVHLSATVMVLVLSVSFGVNKTEAIAVVFSIAIVRAAEMIFTALKNNKRDAMASPSIVSLSKFLEVQSKSKIHLWFAFKEHIHLPGGIKADEVT